jgi:hypothetical protein
MLPVLFRDQTGTIYNFESECVSFYLEYIRGPDSRPCLHLGLVVVTLWRRHFGDSLAAGWAMASCCPLFNLLSSML